MIIGISNRVRKLLKNAYSHMKITLIEYVVLKKHRALYLELYLKEATFRTYQSYKNIHFPSIFNFVSHQKSPTLSRVS